MTQIFLDGDRELVSQPLRFRLFNMEFATLMEIDLSSPTGNDSHSYPEWSWKPYGSMYVEPDSIPFLNPV